MPPLQFDPPAAAPDAAEDAAVRDWLTLSLAPRIGPRTFLRLLEQFGSPSAVLAARDTQLANSGLKPDTITALKRPDPDQLAPIFAWAKRPEAHLITLIDPRYPPQLAEIADPPPVLYARGQVAWLAEPQLAIVGSRNPSAAGREITASFARWLAEQGLIITSGLAVGVDGAAHSAALERGASIAVLGTGPDQVYPAEHRDLARRLVERGVMVSELPPGTGPLARNFPRRNRLISGLSLGVLVTEAALNSGSLITARLALEHGREVFAIPGSIRNPLARGCHALIRDGAKLVEEPDDILAELAPRLRAELTAAERPALGARSATRSHAGSHARFSPSPVIISASAQPPFVPTTPLSPEQAQLLQTLGHDPANLDELTERTGWAVEQISAMLLLLELEGHVSCLPGGRYARVSSAT